MGMTREQAQALMRAYEELDRCNLAFQAAMKDPDLTSSCGVAYKPGFSTPIRIDNTSLRFLTERALANARAQVSALGGDPDAGA